MIKVLMILANIIFAAGGNLLLKSGMNAAGSVSETHLPLAQYALLVFTKPQILIGVGLYIVSFVMWLALLSMMDISVVYPIFVSAAFLIVMAGSVLWFGENVNLLRALGTLVVAAGIAMVSMSR